MESHQKGFLKLKYFSSRNIDFPFYLKKLLELFFFLFLCVQSLEDSGILMIFE
jgi:hypothetical protein